MINSKSLEILEEILPYITASYLTKDNYQLWLGTLTLDSQGYSINFGYRVEGEILVKEGHFTVVPTDDNYKICVVTDNEIRLEQPIDPVSLKTSIADIIIKALTS